MANDMRYLSAEEEAKLLKPIDEYVGKILCTKSKQFFLICFLGVYNSCQMTI